VQGFDFTLFVLIRIADELKWFPPEVIAWRKRTTLAGFARETHRQRSA